MSKMNGIAVANEALRILDEFHTVKGDRMVTVQDIAQEWTTDLGHKHPLPDEKHQYLRGILERLYALGTVTRERGAYGKKNYRYKITVAKWDRRDPFKRGGGVTPVGDSTFVANLPDNSTQTIINLERKVRDAEHAAETVKQLLSKMSEALGQTQQKVEDLEAQNAKLKEEKDSIAGRSKVITVRKWDGKTFKLKDKIFPKVFTRLKELAECRRNILLYGPAGCGKTTYARLLSEVLDLPFASISLTPGITEAHLLGRSVPDLTHGKNRFQPSDFLTVYESGGIGLLDELDAADPSVLLALNSGLANGYMNIPNRPDKPRAIRSDDFVCVATANTIGRGATRMYVGRNAVDESTRDRFRIGQIECDYDEDVEKALVPDEPGKKEYTPRRGQANGAMKVGTYGNVHSHVKVDIVKEVLDLEYGLRGTCQYIRDKIEEGGLRQLMSTRFMEDARIMMVKADWTLRTVLEVYFESWTDEEKAKVR